MFFNCHFENRTTGTGTLALLLGTLALSLSPLAFSF